MTKKHPDIHDEFEESRDIEFSGIDPAKEKILDQNVSNQYTNRNKVYPTEKPSTQYETF